MADLAHVIGEDLQLGPSGDLALVTADAETQQRILHRLLTSPGTYIWQLSYGAGLPALIGSTVSQQQVAAVIRAQLGYEASVATTPEPEVSVSDGLFGEINTTIIYTEKSTGINQALTLSTGG